ncbi:DUF871 domain-containing protein [Photobacterium gaetbulicola]|uniref:Outer surface protein n=1 Tax=Photobacterium gaetbulicola Gung47 TaxID=658445 RepID=A0A0C5WQ52_9GAMM|nr:MupG family TIM beta-alpha barrel fold protein [Photobacterium gaetbulicola]AJR05085.1 hypothetical protein H744_1c0052 [Photobacterium gaetbulicola Gung47]PSU06886.1 DUF871 domain-containing protein [Photobacterium gaetbulicola]
MKTKRIGISVYPQHSDLDEIKAYIDKASNYGYSRLFTCLLCADGDKEAVFDKFKAVVQHAVAHGMIVVADVDPRVFRELQLSHDDLSFFKEMGLTGIRLDEGFTGFEEAMMTFNPQELLIEINISPEQRYLENILNYQPNRDKLIGCHNFYPKKYSGLGWYYFMERSESFRQEGIRVAAFVNAPSAELGPWPVSEGLCTIEAHRDLSITTQAKELFNSGVVDDVLIANAFASDQELAALASVNRALLELDVELHQDITDVERAIVLDQIHWVRGDINERTIRSSHTRNLYKGKSIKPKGTNPMIRRGDVIVENDAYNKYTGELHIALQDFENTGCSNVVGRISHENIRFLDQLKPWQKFNLTTIS